jgi:hypothetical protein
MAAAKLASHGSVIVLGTVGDVTPAGTGTADATALAYDFNTATGDGTAGVKLPAAQAGARVWVYNTHATLGLVIYPHDGGDINDGTTDAAVTAEGKSLASFVGVDSTTWAAMYTADS